jgi:two-component system CheB/CheR fusion protein
MGLRPEDVVKSLDDFLRAVHQDDRARVRAEFERCLREDSGFNVEFRVVWPDGSLHWLRDQGKVFNDGDGRPLFMTGACVDITERKRAEEELKEADRKKDEFLALLARIAHRVSGKTASAVAETRSP